LGHVQVVGRLGNVLPRRHLSEYSQLFQCHAGLQKSFDFIEQNYKYKSLESII
jgi:hypothetical protein